MKILVPIKRVIDANIKVRVNDTNTDIDTTNAKMVVNPFCEIALEEALRIKEAGNATEVIAVTIGAENCQEQLRTALALGADRVIHVLTESDQQQALQPLTIAKLLNEVVKQEQPGLVILGKQSIDADNNQTGQMLAALANMPQGTYASEIIIDNDKVLVTREIDGGLQKVALSLPAVITADLRLNEPRYASLPNMMKAKRKPIETIVASELNINMSSGLRTVAVNNPPERSKGQWVNNVQELVEKLKTEAEVI